MFKQVLKDRMDNVGQPNAKVYMRIIDKDENVYVLDISDIICDRYEMGKDIVGVDDTDTPIFLIADTDDAVYTDFEPL